MNATEYIENRLDNQIEWYNKKSMTNQKSYKSLRIIEIIAGAAIPFLAGFIENNIVPLKIVLGLLGLLIVVLTGLITLFKFQENWIEYRTTCESLKHEKYLFLTASQPYDKAKSFNLLVNRVESLISKENTQWLENMKNTENGKSSV